LGDRLLDPARPPLAAIHPRDGRQIFAEVAGDRAQGDAAVPQQRKAGFAARSQVRPSPIDCRPRTPHPIRRLV